MEGIASTAFWTACVRADETKLCTPCFRDPWAARLVKGEGRLAYNALKREIEAREWFVRATIVPTVVMSVAVAVARGLSLRCTIQRLRLFVARSRAQNEGARFHIEHVRRTVFIDEACARSSQRGTSQIVIFGAGLDTRAFRLTAIADASVFEIDCPEVFAFKETRLCGASPRCKRRVVVRIRYENILHWAMILGQSRFEPSKPTLYIMEGFLMYLNRFDQEALLASIPCGRGTTIVGDAFDTANIVVRGPASEGCDMLVNGTSRADVRNWLGHDWLVRQVDSRDDALGAPFMPHISQHVFPYQRFFFEAHSRLI